MQYTYRSHLAGETAGTEIAEQQHSSAAIASRTELTVLETFAVLSTPAKTWTAMESSGVVGGETAATPATDPRSCPRAATACFRVSVGGFFPANTAMAGI